MEITANARRRASETVVRRIVQGRNAAGGQRGVLGVSLAWVVERGVSPDWLITELLVR